MTELDYSVLGVVMRDGPLTAYRVRGRFANSVLATWSASTGSIYPAIRRLTARGLLRASVDQDARGTKDLRITPKGEAIFRSWLRGVTDGLAGNVAHPIRTRVQFLGALAAGDAARFLADAEADCRSELRMLVARISEEPRGSASPRSWALRGAFDELQARLRWIVWVRRSLERSRRNGTVLQLRPAARQR